MVPEPCVLLLDVPSPASQFSSVHVRKDQVAAWVLRVRRYVLANAARCIRRALLQPVRVPSALALAFRLPDLRVQAVGLVVLRVVRVSAMFLAA